MRRLGTRNALVFTDSRPPQRSVARWRRSLLGVRKRRLEYRRFLRSRSKREEPACPLARVKHLDPPRKGCPESIWELVFCSPRLSRRVDPGCCYVPHADHIENNRATSTLGTCDCRKPHPS